MTNKISSNRTKILATLTGLAALALLPPTAQAYEGDAYAYAICNETEPGSGIFGLHLGAGAWIEGQDTSPATYSADAIISWNNADGRPITQDKAADAGAWPLDTGASASVSSKGPILAAEGQGGAARSSSRASPIFLGEDRAYDDYDAGTCSGSDAEPDFGKALALFCKGLPNEVSLAICHDP